MLKKLVKYGNSNALVLDKALLELLNIAEGSVVKIKTDGTSLIITPHQTSGQEKVTKTIAPQEMLHEAALKNMANQSKNEEDTPTYMAELSKVMGRYSDALKKWSAPEVEKALQDLEERFHGNKLDPECAKALLALQQHYAPELIEMDKEIQEISKKYAPEEHCYKDQTHKGAFALAMLDFKKLHEKYSHVLEQLAKLNEDADYIDKSVLLAEKYQATKNSPEYLKEYHQLIATYIPEYTCYQNEMIKIGESFK